MDFSGRTIVVAGGASGLGRATVDVLRERGADVAVIDRNADLLAQTARATGAGVFTADVGDAQQVQAAFAAIDRRYGRIDGLYCSAGIARVERPVHEADVDVWDDVLRVNLRGTFLVVRQAMQRIVAQNRPGAIVCTASVVAEAAIPGGGAAYTASKAAINGFVRQVAVDYAERRIRINAVAPGAIDTPLMWATTPADQLAVMRATIDSEVPLGRIGQPSDIARMVAWLLSDEAAYVTGATFLVDGGAKAKLPLSV